jgi:hypothetical protein
MASPARAKKKISPAPEKGPPNPPERGEGRAKLRFPAFMIALLFENATLV